VVAPKRHHGVDQLDLIVIGHGCLPDDGKAKRCVVLRRAVLGRGEARRGATWHGATRGTAHARCRLPRRASTDRSFLRIPWLPRRGHISNVVCASERLV
jgi:hypothetical protein